MIANVVGGDGSLGDSKNKYYFIDLCYFVGCTQENYFQRKYNPYGFNEGTFDGKLVDGMCVASVILYQHGDVS
jgi:hypothetical protein